jgi:hypothetical protein
MSEAAKVGDDAHSSCGRAKVRLPSIASTVLEQPDASARIITCGDARSKFLKRRAGGRVGGQGIQSRDDERNEQTRRRLTTDTARRAAARARHGLVGLESKRYDARANEAEVR